MGTNYDDLDIRLTKKYNDVCTTNMYTKDFSFVKEEWESNRNNESSLKEYDFQERFSKNIKAMAPIGQKLANLRKDKKANSKKIEKKEKEWRDFINYNRMYERLGVDIIEVLCSQSLLPIVDPKLGSATLFPALVTLRYKLTDTMGYIIPNIRCLDSLLLKENEYEIQIRQQVVFRGTVDSNLSNNEKIIQIIDDLEKMCFEYAEQIICKSDVLKTMELVRAQDPTLVNDIIPQFLSPMDLKYIFAKLIKKKISIKDILLVFELLNHYARYTQDIEELAMILGKKLFFNPEEFK